MAIFLLKKSYNRKDLKEKEFKDLWNAHGVFTTMWIYGKPQKILFFKEHITNLIKSTKNYLRSFWIDNLKSILTNKPIMIKNIPMYEFKDRSKKLI